MINEQIWVIMAIMMILPIVFMIILPNPYGSVATIGTSLIMVFYLRKFMKNITSGVLGGKMKYQCLTCSGMRFDANGTCKRCGGKSRKPI